MEYLSLHQTADKWGISVRRVQTLCAGDRISGAVKIGSYWAIPADAEKPKDARIKAASILVPGKRQKNEKKSCNLSDGVRFLGHSVCYCINAAIEPSCNVADIMEFISDEPQETESEAQE